MFKTGIMIEVFQPMSSDELIIEDISTSKYPKAKFKARLQTLEEKNNNGRYYDMNIGREIVEVLGKKAKERSLLMEIDHPMANSGDEMAARKRAITVELKNSGALLTGIQIKGRDILGEAETLSGFMGPDLYNVIVHDKADIGFSLRMFGRTQVEESTGLSRIVRPIRPINYDVVTNPSHATAKIMEFVTEDIGNLLIDPNGGYLEAINESTIFDDDLKFGNVNENVYAYLEELINTKFRNMGPVEFRI